MNTPSIDYEYLAIRLGLKDMHGKNNIDEARRTWQIWGACQDSRFDDEIGDETKNLETAFGLHSGLPDSVCRKRVQICKELEELLCLQL